MNKQGLLESAIEAVAERGENYGTPEDNFGRIARLWNVHLANRRDPAKPLNAGDIAMMMILMKIARLENSPTHMDSWKDVAGYAACGAEDATTQARLAKPLG